MEEDKLTGGQSAQGFGGEDTSPAGPQTDVPQQEGPEAAPAQSSRDYVYGKLKDRYPDTDFDDEEGRYGAMRNYMDETETSLSDYAESDRRLKDVIDRDEFGALMFAAMARGEKPATWLMENFGIDMARDGQTDEGKKAVADAIEKFNEKAVQNAKDQKEWDDNVSKSLDTLDEFAAAHHLTPEQTSAVFDKVWSFGTKAIMGTYDTQDYELALKALNYDSDVDIARQEGEVNGRNAKIREQLRRSDTAKRMPTSMEGGASTGDGPEEQGPQDWKQKLDADPLGLKRYM